MRAPSHRRARCFCPEVSRFKDTGPSGVSQEVPWSWAIRAETSKTAGGGESAPQRAGFRPESRQGHASGFGGKKALVPPRKRQLVADLQKR